MSEFPRIPPDHPLARAARELNDQAAGVGLEETLATIGMRVGFGELAYLAEQRALRAVAAVEFGVSLGEHPFTDDLLVLEIVRSERWAAIRLLLLACYMDGIAIGWRGNQLDGTGEEPPQ